MATTRLEDPPMIDHDAPPHEPPDALVWIDHEQAIIATRDAAGSPIVERLRRGVSEPESAFEARTIDELLDRGTITVSGPAFARTGLERALVAVTHRPDRIIDVEPDLAPADAADLPVRRIPR
jgi:hypothetical protein